MVVTFSVKRACNVVHFLRKVAQACTPVTQGLTGNDDDDTMTMTGRTVGEQRVTKIETAFFCDTTRMTSICWSLLLFGSGGRHGFS